MKYKLLLLMFLLQGCAGLTTSLHVRNPTVISIIPSKEFESAIIQAGDNMLLATESNRNLLTPEVHPDESIAGILQKQGITRIAEQPDFGREKVLKVIWGVSDKEHIDPSGAYARGITILMKRLSDLKLAYRCSAEGVGQNNDDDIVDEIASRCLEDFK